MAGHAAGKLPCGTPLVEKVCAACRGANAQPTNAACHDCGRFLFPFCEMLVVPGAKCRSHPLATARHPDAPATFAATRIMRMSPEARAAYESIQGRPLADITREVAEECAARALTSDNPEDAKTAVYALIGAAKVKDLE